MNLKNKLALKFSGIITIILLIFSVVVFVLSNLFGEAEFSEKLKSSTNNLVAVLLDSNEIDKEFVQLSYKYKLNIYPNQVLHIYNDSNQIYFKSNDINSVYEDYFIQNLDKKETISFSKGDILSIAFNYYFKGRNYKVITWAIDEDGQSKIKFLLLSMFTLLVLAVFITVFLARYFAIHALIPMNKVIDQVAKVTENNLNERVGIGNGKDEIAILAITFNKMLDRLENSFRLQKTFVSNASHEFRTPLTVMKGQIEVLLLQPRTTDVYIKTYSSLLDDINNQIDLINGLADLASANANFPNMDLSNVSIIELLDECVSELYRNKNYAVVLNIEELQDDENTMYLRASHALLRSALMNVMDNACKFNGTPSCQVNLTCSKQFITINVIDKGLGISSEDLSHIFESFYRSNNTRHIQGHGIGLSLVKKIIEYFNGKITATSELGKGTKMTIILPNLNTKTNFKF